MNPLTARRAFVFIALICWIAPGQGVNASWAGQFHVSVSGTPAGDGTPARPWDLSTAFRHPASVHPGDTLWLHGGVYRGVKTSILTRSRERPILVSQYPGERAAIDGSNSGESVLSVGGAYTWYRGFEIFSASPDRTPLVAGSAGAAIPFGGGVETIQSGTSGTGCKFINLYVHDTRQGFSLWKESADLEVYGCIISHNGWLTGTTERSGHGIYAQNRDGTQSIVDNIVCDNAGHGIHIYGSPHAFLDNFVVEGNVVVGHDQERNILLGGGVQVRNPVVKDNCTFGRWDAVSLDIGWNNTSGMGASNATVEDNYLIGRMELWNVEIHSMVGNTVIGKVNGFRPSAYPRNRYLLCSPFTGKPPLPRKDTVLVRGNKFEPGRATIVIYNWSGKRSVDVNLAGVLPQGASYVIRNARDYSGPPVAAGTFQGHPIPLPTRGGERHPAFVGAGREAADAPPGTFGVFIIEQVISVNLPSPQGKGIPPIR